MTYVIKRDGSKVKWDSNKIVNAVRKAFESCKEEDKFNEDEFKEFIRKEIKSRKLEMVSF